MTPWDRQDTAFVLTALLWTVLLFAIMPEWGYLYRGDMPYFHAVEFAVRDALQHGQFPLWNVYFAEPLFANPQAMVLYPTHALLRFLPYRAFFIADAAFHVWLTVVAVYLLLRDWEFSRLASIGGAVVVGFSTQVMVRVVIGHVAQLPVHPWSILALVFFRRYLHRSRLVDLYLTVTSVVCLVLSGHTQYSFIGILIPGSYALYYILSEKNWRTVLSAASKSMLVGVLSGGLLMVQLLSTLEYFPQTIRVDGFSFAESSTYSINIVRILNVVTPYAPIQFRQLSYGYQEQALYTALMVVGLSIIALRFGPKQYRSLMRYLMVLIAILLVFAMGHFTPLYRLVYFVLPFFRAPSRILLMWSFPAAILTAIGLETLRTAPDDKRLTNTLLLTLLLTAELLLILFVLERVYSQDLLHSLPTYLFSLLPLCIWGSVLLLKRFPLPHQGWMWVVVGALLLDASAASVYMAVWPNYNGIYPSAGEAFTPDSVHRCFAAQIDPAEVRLTQQITDLSIRKTAAAGIPGLQIYSANLTYVRDLVRLEEPGTNLLASSYHLSEGDTFRAGWEPVTQACGLTLFEHEGNLPRIYAVNTLIAAEDSREATRAAIQQPGFDPTQEAIIAGAPEDAVPDAENALSYNARITEYTPNRIRAEVETDQPSLVVIAEPYYPGWQATVDGEEAHIWRTNHAVRGVFVEAGQHTIEMAYTPQPLRAGAVISGATLGLMAVGAVVYHLRRRRHVVSPVNTGSESSR